MPRSQRKFFGKGGAVLNVLVIEDDHDTRVELRSLLETEGFNVLSAANGQEGYKILRNLATPTVVILDQNMPFSSGDEFCATVSKDPSLARVPVIVLSAVKNRLNKFRVARYFRKPIEAAELVNAINELNPAAEPQRAHAVN